MTLVASFVVLLFLYALFSRRLERTVVTAPIVFTAAGAAVAEFVSQWLHQQGEVRTMLRVVFLRAAEIGLVLLLFTDASRTSLQVLRNIRSLPACLLSVGMLLTILLGACAALVVFRKLTIWEAGILAAILAPTDAGLGQIIVNSPRVPMRIRQALNVEAGLNDGLSVPFLLFFFALAVGGERGGPSGLMQFIGEQLGYGAFIGGGIGLAGGWLLKCARREGWMAGPLQHLGVVALPLLCLLASEAAGASMFIAAFVAGLTVQLGFKEAGKHSVEFAEQWGQLLNLSVFFLFGMIVARDWRQFAAAHWLYAALSLTVVRMLPVMISLIGSNLSRATVLFMGWFGPRGLASIVLGLVYLEQETRLANEDTIRLAVMATVFASIFLHGFSALPGMKLYSRQAARWPADAPENNQPLQTP
ncbi:MAG TPA: cation:proton antiporter [Verrucomicrobiae bacterium]|nr:cation:proton antiporter [Verrucomicrobiae bacterium]